MADRKLTVVIAQSQGRNPVKRQLEEEIAAELIIDREIDVSLVPHLYDLSQEHTGTLFLRSVPGDLAVLSWLYPRAARWILDRNGIRGHEGITLLTSDEEHDDEIEETAEPGGIGSVDIPDRKLYCIDLRMSSDAETFLQELRRIADETSVQTVGLMDWIQGSPQRAQLERYLHPERVLSATSGETEAAEHKGNGEPPTDGLPESTKRRWYPVIDYSRCTNCMECIDFCLFGVYGVDKLDRILVEQQDNCKKGCPACSRVCPENAIIFPQHKTPAIAGAQGDIGGLKIDLSKLFGGDSGEAPLEMAVRERDAELLADGRAAVGTSVGLPKRQTGTASRQRDELDDLMDGLDAMDL